MIRAAEVWVALAKAEPKPERSPHSAQARPAKRPARPRKQPAEVIVEAPVADIQPDENGEIYIPLGRQSSALSETQRHRDGQAA